MATINILGKSLNDIFDFLPDATFAIDPVGKIIAWNKAIEEMTGVPAAEMIGKGNHEYSLPFYNKRTPALIDLVFKTNEDIEKNYHFIKRHKDVLEAETEAAKVRGKNVYLRAKACAIRDTEGKVIGGVEIIRDITRIKLTELALKKSESRLKEQTLALEQKNIDLRDILEQVDEEKKRIEDQVFNNVEHIVMPILKKIKLHGTNQKQVELLQKALEELTSSFGSRIGTAKFKLTPREIEICNMIKNGLTGKEISKLLNLSFQTVEMHRKNIRKKLGLAHKKVNLATFLNTQA